MKSPWGTLLLATINTLQGNTVIEDVVWAGFRSFFKVLEKELDLEYGKILLALGSPSELQAILKRDWPYLDSYKEALDACLQKEDCNGVSKAIGELTTNQISSLLSPHLIESEEGIPPFALIPFCAYQGQLGTLGQRVSHFPSLSVCSKSTPTIVDGALCHTIAPTGLTTKQGEKFGVVILIDSNPVTLDPDLHQSPVQVGQEDWKDSWNVDELGSRNEADMFFSTLNRFRGKSQGHFSLTGLKIMTATEKFLDQRGSSGSCSVKGFDECHQEAFIERVAKDCGCIPFSLSLALPQQVQCKLNCTKKYFIQVGNICTPNAFDCYTELRRNPLG